MRFMIMVKADENSEAGVLPSEELTSAMARYNAALADAGVLLTADGLHPSSRGAKVRFASDGTTTVIDGPFTEAKELIAGFWLLQVRTREEAIEWARRIPNPDRTAHEVEIRQVFDAEDFGPLREVYEGEHPGGLTPRAAGGE